MADKEYGKFLKKLRIDKEEMLQDMAKRLGLQSSYLSAIESGNRDIPAGFSERVRDAYELSQGEFETLHNAEVDADRKVLQMNMEKVSGNRLAKETALNFAGKFGSLSDGQLERINAILNERR